METEEEIVYSIIDVANKGGINDDALINERLVRAFLATYRASLIEKYSDEGMTVSDELFQVIANKEFINLRNDEFIAQMPKFIRLKNVLGAFGIKFEKQGEVIPIVDSESYGLAKKSTVNMYHPKAKIVGSTATVYIGKMRVDQCKTYQQLNDFIKSFYIDMAVDNKIYIDITAILQKPDDDPNYNWTVTPYPLDAESIAELKTQILMREYNVVFQAKNDKVTNGDDNSE